VTVGRFLIRLSDSLFLAPQRALNEIKYMAMSVQGDLQHAILAAARLGCSRQHARPGGLATGGRRRRKATDRGPTAARGFCSTAAALKKRAPGRAQGK
jgi:hypothetical protein